MDIEFTNNAVLLKLSRKNLKALIAKLDNKMQTGPALVRTVGDVNFIVLAEEDDAHYGARIPGKMLPETEERMKLNDRQAYG